MARKGRQSMNSSVVTVTNESIREDGEKIEWSQIVQRFKRPVFDKELELDIIGNANTLASIKRKIDSLLNIESAQRNILLTGPSGTGKTTIVKKIASEYETKLQIFNLKASWLISRQFGDPDITLRNLFEEAVSKAPSLIFIDQIDKICAEKRSQNEFKDRVFNVLEEMLEGLSYISAKVLVIVITNRPDILDPQVRQPYFNYEIPFKMPPREDRIDILKHLTKKYDNDLTEEQFEQVAEDCHCYLYRDLSELCNIASDLSDGAPITYSILKEALSIHKPAATKFITSACPSVKWDDIGGVAAVKMELVESVIWPIKYRAEFQKSGIITKGVLLYGPPGCSKTMLAQALATESKYNFISIKGPELFSKYVGDSEAAVRNLYRNARAIAPCIIFFDEIDGFAQERTDNQSSSVGGKCVTQLLTELNEIGPCDDVFTIAATNKPYQVDCALLRPGRLDPAIYIPLPPLKDRKEIFRVHMNKINGLHFEQSFEDIVSTLAESTEFYSGAEIAKVCQFACRIELRERLLEEERQSSYFITNWWRYFAEALDQVKPKTRAEHVKAFEQFGNNPLVTEQTSTETPASEISKSFENGIVVMKKTSNLTSLMRSMSLKRKPKK